MAKHAHWAYVLLDPVQDYEESITILGVYGSLQAAQMALPRLRRLPYDRGGVYEFSTWRTTWVELRVGDQLLGRWEFDPESNPRWTTLIAPPSADSGEAGR